MTWDLVLSSGFLAFGRQVGFLTAVEEHGLPVDGICGTSSGALAGSMWAAGLPAARIEQELTARMPLAWVRPHARPWLGAFALDAMIAKLRELLPPTFADLERPLGVGVMTLDGRGVLLTEGPLPEAVAASCAIPRLFTPVTIGDAVYADGGMVDRTALASWRAVRGERRTLVHLVERSGTAALQETGDHPVVRTPCARARLWNLGDFAGERDEARRLAHTVLGTLG